MLYVRPYLIVRSTVLSPQATSDIMTALLRVLTCLALPLWMVDAASLRDSPKKIGRGGVDGLAARAEFISFSQYLHNTKIATFKDYATTNVSDDNAFSEIKKHIFTMYGGV